MHSLITQPCQQRPRDGRCVAWFTHSSGCVSSGPSVFPPGLQGLSLPVRPNQEPESKDLPLPSTSPQGSGHSLPGLHCGCPCALHGDSSLREGCLEFGHQVWVWVSPRQPLCQAAKQVPSLPREALPCSQMGEPSPCSRHPCSLPCPLTSRQLVGEGWVPQSGLDGSPPSQPPLLT